MSLLPENIPERDRISLSFPLRDAELFKPLSKLSLSLPRESHAGKISFHISHKDRDAKLTKTFGEGSKSYGFSSSRSTGDKPVTVRHGAKKVLRGRGA
jgi:hypothetical protein